MKDRFLNVLKWFFIVLGILFFAQIVLLIMIMVFANTSNFNKMYDFQIKQQKLNTKEIQKIIDYIENYKQKNGKYPKTIEGNIKLNKNTEYKYSTSNEDNCYLINVKNTKTSAIKQYQHCNVQKHGSVSISESFIETK